MSENSLNQSQSQQQTLTPQMRKGLELLQANTMELGQLLRQAVEINPVLEEISSSISLDKINEDESAIRREDSSNSDDDYREYSITESRSTSSSQEDQKKRDYLFESLVHPETLQQHLLSQLENANQSATHFRAAEEVIGSLDERGFLTNTLEEIAKASPHQFEDLEDAQILLQGFNPPGVAANDLRDSLLIQTELLGYESTSLPHQIIDEHLDLLAKKDHSTLAKKLNTTVEHILEAAKHIANLNPDPGGQFDGTHNPQILPDLEIRKNSKGEWVPEIVDSNLPQLRISDTYKGLLAEAADKKELRSYLRQHINEGRSLLKAIDLRRLTLLSIGHQLIKKQLPLLEEGFSKLRPLTMQETAEAIELNPSTISRAVAGKYLLTPHGLIEMRRLFSAGYHTADGQDLATSSIKETISKLIAREDKNKPLSDSAILKLLEEKGLKIARRTIAKYREQLHLPPSHQRKTSL